METKAFSELFPLFNTANSETLEWLVSLAVEQEYQQEEVVITENAWGNAVYFIVSGWVKVKRSSGEEEVTLAILGRGEFFGEMAILDEPSRSTEAIALSEVKLLSVSAQRFIQTLFKDSQLHHKLLQLMVRRLRETNFRLQLHHQPPVVKLAHTLVSLADNYGKPTEEGTEIFHISDKDFADVAELDVEETRNVMSRLQSKGWVETDPRNQTMRLTNLKQLTHLAGGI
ncbi:MAG: transcriptional regulator [Cyanobacteria bacterium SW_7_48_12]|nr:MAG: transcriptional regulator [Cyanobacteria bacterium SW_7_48_12]